MEKEIDHDTNYTPVHSRAELIRVARESCIRNFNGLQQEKTDYATYKRVYQEPPQPSEEQIINKEEEVLFEENEDKKEGKTEKPIPLVKRGQLFWNEDVDDEDEEFKNQETAAKPSITMPPFVKNLLIRAIFAVIIVGIVIIIDKCNVSSGKINSKTIQASISENTTMNDLEESVTKLISQSKK